MTKTEFVTIEEVAKQFDVTPKTINNWVDRGLFPQPMRVGLRYKRWLKVECEAHFKNLLDERGKRPKKATADK